MLRKSAGMEGELQSSKDSFLLYPVAVPEARQSGGKAFDGCRSEDAESRPVLYIVSVNVRPAVCVFSLYVKNQQPGARIDKVICRAPDVRLPRA